MLLICIVVLYNHNGIFSMVLSAFLIHGRVADSDWSSVICCLNAVKKCDTKGTILCIRDVKNLELNCLHELFQILQVIKEEHSQRHKPQFPVILETSDNLCNVILILPIQHLNFITFSQCPIQKEKKKW